MRIATYNVNGVNGRLPVLLRWLEGVKPDIVCLQELKAEPAQIPEVCKVADYHAFWHGMRAYSGVSLHIRKGAFETQPVFRHPAFDMESRIVQAELGDLVVASERAGFEWAYHKTGLSGAESSTFFLPRLVGFRKAMELVLLNPRLGAEEARELGLVNRVWPMERFEEETMALAQRLAGGPTGAYAVAKNLLNQAAGVDRLDYHLDQELQHLVRTADGPEFAEGLAAFFERRAPVFGEPVTEAIP